MISTSYVEASECFPECRDGYLCSPEGECVSACNPPCDDSEACDAEERVCRSSEEAGDSTTPAVSTSQDAVTPVDDDEPYLFGEVSAIYQAATHEEDDGSVGQGGFGLAASLEYLPGIANMFVRPRVVLIFVEDEVLPEISVDIGYRFAWQTKRALLGLRVAAVPALWIDPTPDDSLGFYIGGQAAPFAQFGRFHVTLPFEIGLQTIFDQDVVYITGGLGVGYAF